MAGLVIIRKAINTPILFNWCEFICHSLLSRLPSSSLPVVPGFIFVHALFVVCMLGTCLLSIQWWCSVWAWQQTDVWDAAVAATEEKACLHNPACMNKVCVSVWAQWEQRLYFFMLPSSLFLFLPFMQILFSASCGLFWMLLSHLLFFICNCGVPAALLTNLFFFLLPLLLSLSVCFLIPPSWHSLLP